MNIPCDLLIRPIGHVWHVVAVRRRDARANFRRLYRAGRDSRERCEHDESREHCQDTAHLERIIRSVRSAPTWSSLLYPFALGDKPIRVGYKATALDGESVSVVAQLGKSPTCRYVCDPLPAMPYSVRGYGASGSAPWATPPGELCMRLVARGALGTSPPNRRCR